MNDVNDPARPAAAAGESVPNPPPTTPPPAAAMVDNDWPPDRRLLWGLAAVGLWLLLFAMGVLIPSETSRKNLGWKPPGDAKTELANQQQDAVAKLQQRLAAVEEAAGITAKPIPAASAPAAAADPTPVGGGRFWDFVIAALSFLPLNAGLLCILAAFIGGCSVNKEEIWQLKADLAALQPADEPTRGVDLRRRLNYLTEHPGYSAIRGLVVYLVLISGLFIVGGDPMGDASDQLSALTQYMRLAGLFSFFGYLAGYDPTVFTSLLRLGSSRLRPTTPEPAPKNP